MKEIGWAKECPANILISDPQGEILEMNDQAVMVFKSEGGRKLIGSNMLDCHPDPAKKKVAELQASRKANIDTIENNGFNTLIYQSPWYKDREYAGMVEIELELPTEVPHIVRTEA